MKRWFPFCRKPSTLKLNKFGSLRSPGLLAATSATWGKLCIPTEESKRIAWQTRHHQNNELPTNIGDGVLVPFMAFPIYQAYILDRDHRTTCFPFTGKF